MARLWDKLNGDDVLQSLGLVGKHKKLLEHKKGGSKPSSAASSRRGGGKKKRGDKSASESTATQHELILLAVSRLLATCGRWDVALKPPSSACCLLVLSERGREVER